MWNATLCFHKNFDEKHVKTQGRGEKHSHENRRALPVILES